MNNNNTIEHTRRIKNSIALLFSFRPVLHVLKHRHSKPEMSLDIRIGWKALPWLNPAIFLSMSKERHFLGMSDSHHVISLSQLRNQSARSLLKLDQNSTAEMVNCHGGGWLISVTNNLAFQRDVQVHGRLWWMMWQKVRWQGFSWQKLTMGWVVIAAMSIFGQKDTRGRDSVDRNWPWDGWWS